MVIGFEQTQDSNNFKSPMESKNINICNIHMIFFPQNSNNINQIQILIPNYAQNQMQIQVQTQNKKFKRRKRNFLI